jgi:thymidylate synthase
MKHVKITVFDCPAAYVRILNHIYNEGEDFFVGYGSEISRTKKLDVTIEIEHPENRPLISDKAPNDMKYVQGYALEYLWCGEKKPGETYTYSSRMTGPDYNQVERAIENYCREKNDRQNTIEIGRPWDILKFKDRKKHEPPCLRLIDTEILDNKMNLTCYFRSWDAYAGLPANIAGIQLFNEAFVKDINQRGIQRSEWEEIETGKLIFHSKNCHIYERNMKPVEVLLGIKSKDEKQTHFQRIQDMKSPSKPDGNAHGN